MVAVSDWKKRSAELDEMHARLMPKLRAEGAHDLADYYEKMNAERKALDRQMEKIDRFDAALWPALLVTLTIMFIAVVVAAR